MRAEGRRPGPGGHAGGDEERQLQDGGAQQQVPADDHLGADGCGSGPPVRALAHEGTDEQGRRRAPDRSRSRPRSPRGRGPRGRPGPGRAPGSAASPRARSGPGGPAPRRRATSHSRPGRSAAAARRTRRSAASPPPPSRRDPHHRPRSRVSGPASSWNSSRTREPETDREPGRLDALGDGPGPVAGTRPAGGSRGGAVGEEVQQRRRPRQQRTADRQSCERDGAEVADDRGVDQQVQRLRRQDDQGGDGEREEPTGERGRPRGPRTPGCGGRTPPAGAWSRAQRAGGNGTWPRCGPEDRNVIGWRSELVGAAPRWSSRGRGRSCSRRPGCARRPRAPGPRRPGRSRRANAATPTTSRRPAP